MGRNIDPTFAHALAGDDQADLRIARRLAGVERIAESHGVCAYCLQAYSDHDTLAQVADHAARYAEVQAEWRTPQLVRTTADTLVQATSLVYQTVAAHVGRPLTSELARAIAGTAVQNLHLARLLP